jgi:hypothetical protein
MNLKTSIDELGLILYKIVSTSKRKSKKWMDDPTFEYNPINTLFYCYIKKA